MKIRIHGGFSNVEVILADGGNIKYKRSEIIYDFQNGAV